MPLEWNDMDDTALGLAVQDNLFALFRVMGGLPDAVCESTPFGTRHSVPGFLNPMFQGVFQSHLSEAGIPGAVLAICNRRSSLSCLTPYPSSHASANC